MRENTHPMEHEEVMAYLDGELTSEAAAKAAEHLRECRECQALAADLQSVSRHMASWQITAADTLMSPTITAALDQHESKFTRRSTRSKSSWPALFGGFRIPGWAWAVSAAALIQAIVAVQSLTSRHMAVPTNQIAMGQAAEPRADNYAAAPPSPGAIAKIETPDGGNRDRLRAMQSQMASNMELSSNLAVSAPSPRSAATSGDNAGNAVTINYAATARTMIARTAQLTIIVKNFDTSQKRLEEILQRHGGYVGEMTTSAPEGADRKLSATLRVPADQLDAAISEVKELGRVESESQSGEEVTSQYIDLQARLTNARNTEQRLTELLRRQTGKLDEVVTVEEKISDVREQIERMEAEQKNLSQRVDFGTLSVSFSEERKSQLQVMPPSVGTQFHNAAVEGYRSVVDGVVSLLVFFMSWGPSLLLWGAILYFPARLAWRRLRRADA